VGTAPRGHHQGERQEHRTYGQPVHGFHLLLRNRGRGKS
jgi:hypothetical protein